MDLLIIRHALPQRVETVGRAADPPLSELGHVQARALAAWLEPEGVDALYTSPLQRALETAAPVAEALGLPAQVVDEVAEYDRHSEEYVPIEELKASNDPRWQELIDGDYFAGTGVTAEEFQGRVIAGMDRIIADNPSRTAAVVCHGGVMNAFVGHVIGLADFMVFEPAYTGITRVKASSRGHRSLVSMNEHGHLRSVESPTAPT